MTIQRLAFDQFVLDFAKRELSCDGVSISLNSRYFDALVMLVRARGEVVTKEQFFADAWHGVPVTDEALTQCIKTLRKRLGDNASSPRLIATVPKHGYRFIAEVAAATDPPPAVPAVDQEAGSTLAQAMPGFLTRVAAGTAGGGLAGIIGGLLYGLAASTQSMQPGSGAISIMVVVVVVTVLLAVIGAAGICLGISAATAASRQEWYWSTLGGAAGGLLIGAVVRLIGLDAFDLLFGYVPADMTGASEGLVLGATIGLSVWIVERDALGGSLRRSIAAVGLLGLAAGILIALGGGRLMGGSLLLLAETFPESRLRLEQIGTIFGETGFGLITRVVTSGLEGLLFATCIAGGILLMVRRGRRDHQP